MRKLLIKYELRDVDGTWSRSFEYTADYQGFRTALAEELDDVIERFLLRNEQLSDSSENGKNES